MLAEILASNKSDLCRNTSLAFSFLLMPDINLSSPESYLVQCSCCYSSFKCRWFHNLSNTVLMLGNILEL